MRKVRDNLTAAEKSLLWEKWRTGESLKSIGRTLSKNSSSVHWYVTKHGGIQPKDRKRCTRHLSIEEREEISRGVCNEESFQEIGRQLNRPASTISREVERNGGREQYRAALADETGLVSKSTRQSSASWHKVNICVVQWNKNFV